MMIITRPSECSALASRRQFKGKESFRAGHRSRQVWQSGKKKITRYRQTYRQGGAGDGGRGSLGRGSGWEGEWGGGEEGCTGEKRTLVADRERLKIGRKVGCVYNKRSENELGAGVRFEGGGNFEG